MELRDYVTVVRARWRIIAACMVVLLALGGTYAALSGPTYTSTTQLFVSSRADSGDSALAQEQFVQQRVKSYADIVDSPLVTTPVIRDLDLRTTPDRLARDIDAAAPVGTVLLNVTVRDSSPRRAQLIARALAERLVNVIPTLDGPAPGSAQPVRVAVVRQADLPTSPSSLPRWLPVIVALALGAATGVVLAVLRDKLDDRVRTGADVTAETDLPLLAVVGEEPGRLRRASPAAARSELYRRLRVSLVRERGGAVNLFAVTSGCYGEGASAVAGNLSLAVARGDQRVVLVDADHRDSGASSWLRVDGQRGLAEVLLGECTLADALSSGPSGLRVLAAGRSDARDLLGTDRMRRLFAELRGEFDAVVLHAPAVLEEPDAAVLSAMADRTLLVVGSGRLRPEQVRATHEALVRHGATVDGVVLSGGRAGRGGPARRAASRTGTSRRTAKRTRPTEPELSPQAAPGSS